MLNLQLAMPGGMEWIIILAIVVLVFGAAKLPALARSSGQALRIFKSETRALRNEDDEVTGEVVADAAQPIVEESLAEPVERDDNKA
jgi:sec-independent protein translocase protein TatA